MKQISNTEVVGGGYTSLVIPLGYGFNAIFERVGNIVMTSRAATGTSAYPAVSDWTLLNETMPLGYRPIRTCVITGIYAGSQSVVIQVRADGTMNYYTAKVATSTSLAFSSQWYTADPWPT